MIYAVLGKSNVNVIARLVVLVGNRFNDHVLEGNQLVLNGKQSFFIIQKIGSILCFRNVLAKVFNEGEGRVNDFNFTGPLALVAAYDDASARNELLSVSFFTSHFIDEICAILIGSVYGDLVVPPGLSILYIAENGDFIVQFCCAVLVIAHGTKIIFFFSFFCSRGFFRLLIAAGCHGQNH